MAAPEEREPLRENGAADGLEWRLLSATLLGEAGTGRHGTDGPAALHAGPWSEEGLGGAVRRVAGPPVSAAVAGAGAAAVPVVQLDEALAQEEKRGGGERIVCADP